MKRMMGIVLVAMLSMANTCGGGDDKAAGGAEVNVNAEGVEVKAGGNEVTANKDGVAVKAADGEKVEVKADGEGNGDGANVAVEANEDGAKVAVEGEDGAEVKTKDGDTTVKSGDTKVEVGKDGNVKIDVPGMKLNVNGK